MQASIELDRSPAVQYLLRIGDTCLILAQRLGEWCGHAPVLKEDIAMAAFKYSIAKIREVGRTHMEGAVTYKQQLLKLLDFYSQYVFDPPVPGGCPLLNTAIEADDHHTFMRSVVAHELVASVDFISSLIEKGIIAGEFKPGINSHALAYLFFCSIEGALMFARAEQSEEPMVIIVEHCKKILNEISV